MKLFSGDMIRSDGGLCVFRTGLFAHVSDLQMFHTNLRYKNIFVNSKKSDTFVAENKKSQFYDERET